MAPAPIQSQPAGPSPRRVVVPHQAPWRKRVLAAAIYALIRLLAATVSYRFDGPLQLFKTNPPQPVIYCIWHNRLALCIPVFRKYVKKRQPSRRMAAMVSASRDGAMLARILELLRVQPVRGSSSRRGHQALLELTTWGERGYDLAITPDGPRGPCYVVQEGVIALAQLTGQPIVPASINVNWKIRARSWDRFQIPLPLARVTVKMAEPIHVPRAAGETERARLRKQLEEALKSITED